jgi:hypothetical protein
MLDANLLRRVSTAVLTVLIIITGFVLPAAARAQTDRTNEPEQLAPANDNFDNAALLGGNSGNVTSVNTGASKENAEPAHARNRGGASIWYKYAAPGIGVLTLDTSTSSFDTTLAVYRGTGLNDLKLVAANDDTPNGTGAVVTVGTNFNDVFYIAVDGYYDWISGTNETGTVKLNYQLTNAGANDNFANAKLLSTGSRLVTSSNVGASKEVGESTLYGNAGGKSLWYKWTAPISGVFTVTVESANLTGTGGVKTLFGLATGSAVNTLTFMQSYSRTNYFEANFKAVAGTTYYITLDGVDNGSGAETGTFTVGLSTTNTNHVADFDRDGRTDLAVFRPITGTWYSLDSATDKLRSRQFGTNGDKPLLADLGQDGLLDYIVYRPDVGSWYINDSETGFRVIQYGNNIDLPMTLHNSYDSAIIQFRPSSGNWYYYNTQGGFEFHFGANGDIPMYGNFVGNALDRPAVFRPSTGMWYFSDYSAYTSEKFGQNGDKPVPADYDGDGVIDVAVFRPASGTWYIHHSKDNSVTGLQWGMAGDVPQPADYDGDNRADPAVFRAGVWYIRQSSTGTLRAVQFGAPGDIPVSVAIH